MKEGDPVADHVNEFNSSLSRLMSVDIKFNDEVQALLLLSLLLESWSGIVTAVSGSTGTTKLKFDNIKTKGGAESKTECESRTEWPKPVASNDKEVHMEVRDYDDALVCCVENTIDDHIMDSGASFHATYCKEELERFMLCSGKDVRYSPGLKKRLISVRQLDKEGYHVGFGDQQWKGNTALWHKRLGPISEKGMKTLASKGRIPDIQKAIVGFCKPCVLRKQKKKAAVDNKTNLRVKCLKFDNGGEYSSKDFIEYCVENGIRMLKTISETPQRNAKAATDSSNLTKPNQKDQVALEDSLENLANNSIVVEHGLSSEITRSLGGSSDTSAGSENSRIFKDSRRSDKEDSKDGASSEEGGSETP
ncbi:retrovirus-related pol polyprotein from transposon TNT 1-94 [Tanacetum coccineum]